MPSGELPSPISFQNDADGVHVNAPLPGPTAWKLIRRSNLIVPILTAHDTLSATTVQGDGDSKYEHRMPKPGGAEMVRSFRNIVAQEGRAVSVDILSGREPRHHETTRQWFYKWGYRSVIDDFNLNPHDGRKHSLPYKVNTVKTKVDEGYSVVEVDDDLAVSMNLPSNVLAYVMKNFTNNAVFRHWAGLELPANVIPVNSFEQLLEDFSKRLKNGQI
ncbi:MAG TPA: hypothetical protein VG965_06205 [Patescibacteria group bacterium]|nr:hypothetical protein [Patescibacteria group bacterium]